LEWDPAHFRIFVGNLAGEVTDETLLKAFSQYPSVQKARVIREKRTTKSKGYGFVSFSNADDYFRAAREQNGKYVGSHPIVVKKAMTDVRPATQKQNKHKGKGGAGGHGKVQHGGVDKKPPKTKGGLKVLG
jgi:RNA recognition motif-containing protein